MTYNPIGRTTLTLLAFPVTTDSFEVVDEEGIQLTAQVC